MDRIDSLGESFPYKHLRKKTGKKEKTINTGFSNVIESLREEGSALFSEEDFEEQYDQLESLLSGIAGEGEELVRHPTLQNVKKYREKVKHFISYLVKHNIEVTEQFSGTTIMRRKKYMVIKIIDDKLEELSKEFLRGQAASLSILQRVEEINGLLVDLMR
ncbi:MAG: DUF327 family protein [Spirochaetaceae bacterium]|nr:MAG: DUF327 family protein [Spirochaetaceae bacterium]